MESAAPTAGKSARKDDEGKTPFDLLPSYPMEQLGRVYAFGCMKYERNNWRKGFRWGRLFAAAMRHLWAFWKGENNDPESGLPHLAHAMWCLVTLMEMVRLYPENDDRWDGEDRP